MTAVTKWQGSRVPSNVVTHGLRTSLRRVAAVLAAALTLAAAGCAPVPEGVQPAASLGTYHASGAPVIQQGPATIGFADSDLYGLSTERANADLSRMTAVGVDSIRLMVPWAGVEPTPGSYDWRLVDRMIDAAAAHHMSVLATLNSTPVWAVAPGLPPLSGRPTSAADYGRFAGAVAQRFRGRISAYEIWNEPNATGFYAPNPDPSDYVALLKAAYPAIKAQDPAAPVVTGGLGALVDFKGVAMDAVKFVRGMYAAGGEKYFDAIGYHPYQYTMKFSEGGYHPNSPISQMSAIRELMVANGDADKKIWATEYGEPSSVAGETGQAAYLDDMLRRWRTIAYAGPVFVYTVRDRDSRSADPDDTLGIYQSDGTVKPATQVINLRAEPGNIIVQQAILGSAVPR
jgi:hypothetical protein